MRPKASLPAEKHASNADMSLGYGTSSQIDSLTSTFCKGDTLTTA
ncbi:MAG: hypothetical protein WKF77_09745 [Planctomycetaceae bacterium]